MKGLMNESRSFFWRMFHSLLPTQKNLNKTNRRVESPNCVLCDSNVPDDSFNHCFIACSQSDAAMNWLLTVIKSMNPTADLKTISTLQFETSNQEYTLESVWLIGVTMEYIWSKRKSKQQIDLNDMKAKIKAKCAMFCKSTLYGQNATNLKSRL